MLDASGQNTCGMPMLPLTGRGPFTLHLHLAGFTDKQVSTPPPPTCVPEGTKPGLLRRKPKACWWKLPAQTKGFFYTLRILERAGSRSLDQGYFCKTGGGGGGARRARRKAKGKQRAPLQVGKLHRQKCLIAFQSEAKATFAPGQESSCDLRGGGICPPLQLEQKAVHGEAPWGGGVNTTWQ